MATTHTPHEPDTPTRSQAATQVSDTRPAESSRNLALIAMLFAVAMTFIDQTIVAIAAPSIQTQLSLSRSGTQ
jgi:hypothetical protein